MIVPVILCGGSGTRLWPLSRATYPKQLIPLFDGLSLLQKTLERVQSIPAVGKPVVLCNEAYRFIVAEQLAAVNIHEAQIILEPVGKNTAPAATMAALWLAQQDPNTTLLILPADHFIQDHQAFAQVIARGEVLAQEALLVAFGIVPTRPETGFGYIQQGAPLRDGFQIQLFVEKPELETAKAYLASGGYYWNSGMFMARAQVFLAEVQQYAPDILEACQNALAGLKIDYDFMRIPEAAFSACRSDSIDYAVMEKSQATAVLPFDAAWCDVGSWESMWQMQRADAQGNVVKGDVVCADVSNSYLHAESRLLAVTGLKDVAIIETADAVLVAHKDASQAVKVLVAALQTQARPELHTHRLVYRPWGYYQILFEAPGFKVKKLKLKPGAKLSLQTHQFRSEHWVVIQGQAQVSRGDEHFILEADQSTFISAGVKHRLQNTGSADLELIEVQTGSYFGEDDIVRLDDLYHRIPEALA